MHRGSHSLHTSVSTDAHTHTHVLLHISYIDSLGWKPPPPRFVESSHVQLASFIAIPAWEAVSRGFSILA